MARLRFGRPISLRWNGLLIEGPANTVFEIPDEYYEEFNGDIGPVEPTLVWLDPDEGFSLRTRVTQLEQSANGIPQALVDFKGDLLTATADNTVTRLGVGSNGQTLTANSATATGLEWQTPSNDIPVSIVNAKGDLVIGTADNTVSRFGVGTNGQVLTADSNQGDGLVWATPAAGVSLGSASPAALGAAAAGTSANASHEDHVHPTTGLALSGHDHTGVYDTSGTAAAAVSAHEALSDPHPGYLTATEGNAAYAVIAHSHNEFGEAEVLRELVKNDSGVSLPIGTVVYISGADGTNILVTRADADSESTSSKTLGLLAQTLAPNASGYVILEGRLTGSGGDPLNTSTATAGQAVWLSSTAGQFVFGTPPAKPAHSVYLGVVSRSNSNNGEIFVKVEDGYEINELHDVNINAGTLANGQVLSYDAATSKWVNTTSSGGDEFLAYLYF
jgi:hypothetical protein